MNKVILAGRLTKDPEVRYTQTGIAVARFNLAVNRRISKDDQQQAMISSRRILFRLLFSTSLLKYAEII